MNVSRHLPRLATIRLALALAASLPLAACASPLPTDASGEPSATESAALRRGSARLSFGATASEAKAGKTSSLALQATPDLVLHATLASAKYAGQTLLVRGFGPSGELVWSYPHAQKGTELDMVLPVFGSSAARKHVAGAYTFEVTAGGTTVATGDLTFTSEPNASHAVRVAGARR